MAKLHDYYKSDVVNELSKQFGYKTIMQVPRIEKITLNMGVGEAISDKKLLENAAADMAAEVGGFVAVAIAFRTRPSERLMFQTA